MGWFGMGDDTPESVQQHTRGLDPWLAKGDPSDWLVVVDCHI